MHYYIILIPYFAEVSNVSDSQMGHVTYIHTSYMSEIGEVYWICHNFKERTNADTFALFLSLFLIVCLNTYKALRAERL